MKKYLLVLFILIFGLSFFGVSPKSAKASDCAISVTLRVGSRSEQVACLQSFLGISADGKFGPKTKTAVIDWQIKFGLKADGIFGAKSRAAWASNHDSPSQDVVVITSVGSPQTLNVNETGTWTVKAYDKKGGDLTYSVIWGDEVYGTAGTGTTTSNVHVQQTATFTHSYSQPGVYKPQFTVIRNIVCIAIYPSPCPEVSATTSVSVTVGSATTTPTPIISSMSSTSGPVGAQVTISGYNFTENSNKIKFGDTNTENDPAYSLKSNNVVCVRYPCPNSITFTVPSTYYIACLHSTPSCEVPTRMVLPGVYGVSVINANGTTNVQDFTVHASTY